MSSKAPYLRQRWYWQHVGWCLLALCAVNTVCLLLIKTGHLNQHNFNRCLTAASALATLFSLTWINRRLQKQKSNS